MRDEIAELEMRVDEIVREARDIVDKKKRRKLCRDAQKLQRRWFTLMLDEVKREHMNYMTLIMHVRFKKE